MEHISAYTIVNFMRKLWKKVSASIKKNIFIFTLICLGFATFNNILHNEFVSDDIPQIVNPAIIHSPINSIRLFFTSIPNLASPNAWWSFHYRGVMFALYSIIYFFGHGQPELFHVIQLVIHTFNAVLLFYFYKHWVNRSVAFLLATIFLIHPVNQETVAAIANLQDTLFFCFGMVALLICTKEKLAWRQIITAQSLLLLSLLSKETGVVFFVLLILFVAIRKKSSVSRVTLSSGVTLFLYCCIRIIASQQYFVQMRQHEIIHLTLLQKTTTIPILFSYYLQQLFFPDMTILTSETKLSALAIPVSNGLLWTCLFLLVLIVTIVIVHRQQNRFMKIYIFFIAWFVTSICLHLQFIPLEAFAAKRWLYLPSAGLLGAIGILLQMTMKKPYIFRMSLIIGAILCLVWMRQTFVMNTHWQNEHSIQHYTI
jgi:hypothetical protein